MNTGTWAQTEGAASGLMCYALFYAFPSSPSEYFINTENSLGSAGSFPISFSLIFPCSLPITCFSLGCFLHLECKDLGNHTHTNKYSKTSEWRTATFRYIFWFWKKLFHSIYYLLDKYPETESCPLRNPYSTGPCTPQKLKHFHHLYLTMGMNDSLMLCSPVL